ncbi:NAD(P)H steroid dehydrogenase-like protein in alkane synthesis cluster [hydrothermal vent metagenome]|uniref:NAD(P)H steroid dehydrogenase-like protein in alkane synthesis cluster n=1 Tax=hydrothermal vent metagenome TaxID=652676 RepID=A0A3B0VF52_9ZZZZ
MPAHSPMHQALITGGGGFVGRAVINALSALNIKAVILGRHYYPGLEAPGISQVRGDICSPETVIKAARGCDTIFHIAAKAGIWGSKQEYYAINLQGTQNVIKACKVNGIKRLIHTSSPSVVFSAHDLAGIDETAPYGKNFLCHYAASKAAAEKLVLTANGADLKTTALRPHLIWGPGDNHLIPRILERARRGRLIQVGEGNNMVDISYIDNVAEAHILAAMNLCRGASAAGRAYFISQGQPVNLWGWINELLTKADLPVVRKKISFGTAYTIGALLEFIYHGLRIRREPLMTRFTALQLAKSHWFSIKAAEKDLGYRPLISTAAGLRRTIFDLSDLPAALNVSAP